MQEKELAEKYGFDLEELKGDQLKLAKAIVLKDSLDFNSVTRFGAISNMIIQNQIISAIIVCDEQCNILEQQYFLDKLRFPYLYEFRSYREMPAMVEVYNKLNEKPDVIFISGHGMGHSRLGLASHFGIFTGIPTIGVAGELFNEDFSVKNEEILFNGKKVGKVLQSKEKSNPLFISPGNNISIESAFVVAKKFIKFPHKLPEPLHMAVKYAKEIKKELNL